MKEQKGGRDCFKDTIADLERRLIVAALEETGGNQAEAARQLGVTKRILAYRVRKFGIDLAAFGKNRRPIPPAKKT